MRGTSVDVIYTRLEGKEGGREAEIPSTLVYLGRLSLITARVPRPGGKQREDDEEKYGILILICRRYPMPSKR